MAPRRISIAKAALSEGANVSEAFEKSGFGDYSSFFKAFQECTGVTVLAYAQIGIFFRRYPDCPGEGFEEAAVIAKAAFL